MAKIIRRFIAGAVCPRCGEMDKLVIYKKDGDDFRECVACGFLDKRHIQPAPKELETRVNKTQQEKQHETQVLQFPPKR